MHGGKKFWLNLVPDNFVPGFCEQLVGLKREETRLVIVTFAEDFAVKELAGKNADYTITLREIKEKIPPALDDAFANKLVKGKSLADLRHIIEHDLEHEREHEIERAKETQIVKHLNERIQFELPPTLLQNETRRALAELVQRNRERGITDDMLKEIAALEPVGFDKTSFARFVGHKVSVSGQLNPSTYPPTLRVTHLDDVKNISDICAPASEK